MNRIFKLLSLSIAFFVVSALCSCGKEEDLSFDEQISLSNIAATAYADGSITISGTVEANAKIKTFELQDADNHCIADLMSDQLKAKGEDGKKFTMNIASANVKVQEMYIVVKTKGGKEARQQIGTPYKFDLGYGSRSQKGSYVSIVDGKAYTMGQIADAQIRERVEFALSDEKLIPASQCKLVTGTPDKPATYKPESFAKSAINVGSSEKDGTMQGTVLTSTGCIATFTLTPDSSKIDGVIEGVVIKSTDVIRIFPAANVTLSK